MSKFIKLKYVQLGRNYSQDIVINQEFITYIEGDNKTHNCKLHISGCEPVTIPYTLDEFYDMLSNVDER